MAHGAKLLLIDSDVLVWMTRGQVGAAQRLAQIKKGLAMSKAHILPITPSITERAMALIDSHALSNGLQLGDALIAATALEHGLTLLTGNKKHFAKLPGLELEVFKP